MGEKLEKNPKKPETTPKNPETTAKKPELTPKKPDLTPTDDGPVKVSMLSRWFKKLLSHLGDPKNFGRGAWVATRAVLLLTLLLGVAYPLAVTGLAQVAMPWQANGSMLKTASGEVVGSKLIGQSFSDENGMPLPQYFQPRPSAAGTGYDAMASSGTNQGPESALLIDEIKTRRAQIAAFNGVSEADVPADAVTASASGLDPHISPEYAEIQVARVASARGLDAETVRALVQQYTEGPYLGCIGAPGVNVLQLNLALDEL